MEEKVTFGKFVIRKRKEKGLTQRELAEKLYVTESAVSKWERGISYPDISLVSDLCEILGISEHELVTASEDLNQREMEKQAKKFQNLIKTYSWVFYIAYGLSLLVCLICNLAFSHTLSWFFIVLTAEMTAFSLTSLPVLIKKNKAMWSIAAFFVSLNLLLAVCCIYTGGDWFWVAFTSLLLGFSIVFLPVFIRDIPLPRILYSHKALICLALDTVCLFLLLTVTCFHLGSPARTYTSAYSTALAAITLPWAILVGIRYIKVNALFRTSICLFFSGVYVGLINSVLNMTLDNKPFALLKFNFRQWNEENLNGNVTFLITGILILLAVLFCAGGVINEIRSAKTGKPHL